MKGLTNTASLPYIEQLYVQYLEDRSALSSDWQEYFAQLENGDHTTAELDSVASDEPARFFRPAGTSAGR
jgi:2-oxoglutarate dehydrogenase complex dehydrogenase (E1) component-like enzyme